MSATIDAKLFQDYFNDCPLVHITGRNYHVKIAPMAPLGAGGKHYLQMAISIDAERLVVRSFSHSIFPSHLQLSELTVQDLFSSRMPECQRIIDTAQCQASLRKSEGRIEG